MENGLVSVIIPVYNAEKFIEKCLDSVLNQTYSNLEIIAINDGSVDKSKEILAAYENKDKRVIVINKENEGVGIARNIGIDKASGEYLTFVDADDWIETDFLNKLVNSIGDADIAVENFEPAVEKENFVSNFTQFEKNETIDRERFFEDCFDDYTYTYLCWGKLIRKTAIGDIRFLPIPFSEDAVFCREICAKANKIKLICDRGYNYRIALGSVMQDDSRIEERAAGAVFLRYKTVEIYGDGKEEMKAKLDSEICRLFRLYLRRAAKYKIHDKKECRELVDKTSRKFKHNLKLFDKMLIAVIKIKT